MSVRERSRLAPDELVEKLCPDPKVPVDVGVLSGYLGRSETQGLWRLYTAADLTDYVEIREDDNLHHARIGPAGIGAPCCG